MSVRPSSRASDCSWLANPWRYNAWYSQLPLESPVNMRPVRFAPCAAGASPTTSNRASGSPKPGTGFSEYSQSRSSGFFSRATRRQWVRSREQREQRTMERLTAVTEENNRLRLVRSSHPEGWARHGTTLKGSSGESDRETLPHAALDGERLQRDRGAEQPRPYARR